MGAPEPLAANEAHGATLGKRMEALIWDFLDTKFFFRDIEDVTASSALAWGGSDYQQRLTSHDFGTDEIGSMGSAKLKVPPGTRPSAGVARALSYRYRVIRERYAWCMRKPGSSVDAALSAEMAAERRALLRDIDDHTGGWISTARRVLQRTSELGVKHVMVTASHVAAGLCKNLLYDIAQFFPVDDCVFSSVRPPPAPPGR